MRAREFLRENSDSKAVTINIPITITIPAGGGSPSVGTVAAPKGTDLPESPVFVSPLQQEMELMKQQGGKSSKVINQILQDDGAASDDVPKKSDSYDLNEDFIELEKEFQKSSTK
jgi:hypothetical protein